MAIKIAGTTVIDDSRNITTNVGTIDGRDVAADGTKLDGIETGATADQTKADIDALNVDADTLDGQHGSYYTGYTDTAIANLVDSSPATLDTLNELAAALGDDANFSTTITDSIATKLPLAGGTMTGDLVTTFGNSNGIFIGTGGANITSVSPSSKDILIQNVAQIRFGGSSSWDWNTWAGIAFNDSTEVLTIGGPASGAFTSNASPPDITINFDGLSGQTGLKYENQPIFHDGYHPNADKWTTARTLTLSGDASGSVSWDGSANVSLSTALAYRELGKSPVGNFGQFVNHSATTDFNTEPAYWGWSFVQGNANAPNTSSAQWYRARLSLGDAYGKGTASGDYWLEIAIPRTGGSAGEMWTRRCEAGTIGSWRQSSAYVSGNTVFHDSYHPNADKWTTARTLSLTGDASGSVSWDGSANVSLSVTVADDSHTHNRIVEKSAIDYGSAYLQWTDQSGNGGSNGNGNAPSNPTNDWYHHIIANHGNGGGYYVDIAQSFHSDAVYHRRLENGTLGTWQRFFTDVYHPNADKWTTARSHTVTLTGDVTGTATQSVDGTGNKTWSITTTVADDSHNHTHSDGSFKVNGLLTGGIGASTTGGTLDWNHITNARSGQGHTLLLGTHTNGPSGTGYYHPFSFEYNNKDGSGNMTQFAIPYSAADGPYFRSRYSGTWSGWREMWHSDNDGSGSGLDADLLDGYHLSTTRNAANTVPVRDSNGYLQLGWINTTSGATTGTITKIYGTYNGDNYIRYFTPATLISQQGIWTSGNDGTGSGLDADLLDGFNSSQGEGANTVAVRSSAGYLFSNYFNGSGTFSTTGVTSGMARFTGTNGTDTYGRSYTAAAARSLLNVEDGATADQTAAEILTAIKTVDGSGSGLDADTVDGIQGSSFLRVDQNATIPDGIRHTYESGGNIATTTSYQSSLEVYNNGAGTDAFMTFHVGGDYAAYFGLDGGTNDLAFGGWSRGAASYRVWHQGNDGSGSGLDADLLDGNHASAFYLATNPSGYTTNTGTIVETGTTFSGTYPVYFRIGTNNAYSHPNITFTGSTNTLNVVNIAPSGTVDGVDISARDAVLTSTTTTANAAMPKSGGTFTGGISISGNLVSVDNMFINNAIYSEGDLDTYMQFDAANNWRVVTGGADAIRANNSLITLSRPVSVTGSTLDMNNNDIVGVDQIVHEGDTDTYMQFHAADQWRVVTGGTERFEVTNSAITSLEPLYVPDIYLNGNVYHNGDTNTYMGFHANTEWRVVTGGVERLEVNNTQITSTAPIHAPSFHGDGSNLTNIPGPSTTDGDVGTYAWLWRDNAGTQIGTTHAGSTLFYSTVSDGNATGAVAHVYKTIGTVRSGVSPSGTWRSMGSAGTYSAAYGQATLYVRIS